MKSKIQFSVILIFSFIFVSTVYADDPKIEITPDIALKAIQLFENHPLTDDGKAALSIIVTYASKSDDVSITISNDFLPWAGQDVKYANILLGAYIAGNLKPQLIHSINKDSIYLGIVQMINTYNQIKAVEPGFTISEIEKQITLYKNGNLNSYIDSKVKK